MTQGPCPQPLLLTAPITAKSTIVPISVPASIEKCWTLQLLKKQSLAAEFADNSKWLTRRASGTLHYGVTDLTVAFYAVGERHRQYPPLFKIHPTSVSVTNHFFVAIVLILFLSKYDLFGVRRLDAALALIVSPFTKAASSRRTPKRCFIS